MGNPEQDLKIDRLNPFKNLDLRVSGSNSCSNRIQQKPLPS